LNNIIKWDYQLSVEKVRPMVMNWRNLTIEIVEELYRAREELSNRGSWSVIPNGTTAKGWGEYLNDVGLAKTTVHRWLERYEPQERRLMEPEEVEKRKEIETRKKQDESTAIRRRIIECKKTGIKPDDWDDKTEREYQKQLKEDEEREKRIEEAKREMEESRKRKEEEIKRRKEYYEQEDEEFEIFRMAGDKIIEKGEKRKKFKEKIKLSQSGESDLFIDALMDYLDELESDSRRIEACQNIIKVCKNVAVELQRGDR